MYYLCSFRPGSPSVFSVFVRILLPSPYSSVNSWNRPYCPYFVLPADLFSSCMYVFCGAIVWRRERVQSGACAAIYRVNLTETEIPASKEGSVLKILGLYSVPALPLKDVPLEAVRCYARWRYVLNLKFSAVLGLHQNVNKSPAIKSW